MSRSRDVSDQRTSGQATPDKNQIKNKPGHKRRRTIGFMPLEPRVMYDGAAVATAAATHHHHHHDGGPSADSGHAGEAASVGAPNAVTPSVSAPTPSGGDGHWHQAAPTEPMPTVTTWVKNPTEIVFIDQQAPDYQLLASGVKPGIEVVVLDPNSDGLQQIANFLARHPDPNLTTIDIVAHGQDGMLFLGNAVLDNDTVGQYAAQLKTIGASLKPGGDLMLYGCDVAANPDGVNLLAQIIDETGVNVAASTGPVGSAAEGGSWALNAQSGVIDAKSPFTAATMAAYPDVLNADLFVTAVGSSNEVLVDQNGGVTTAAFGSGVDPEQIVLDTADGLYFVVNNGSSGPQILEGKISNALAGNGTLFSIYTDTATSNGQPADEISGIQIDTVNHLIYFVDNKNILVGTNETSVFDRLGYSPIAFTVNVNLASSVTVLGTVFSQNASGDHGGVDGLAMDFTNPNNAEAVFAVSVGGSASFSHVNPPAAELFVAKNLTPTATTATITQLPLNIPVADGFFTGGRGPAGGLAIDDNNGSPVLYFTLFDGTINNGNTNSTTGQGLYSYSLASSNTSGTFTPIYQQTAGNLVQLNAITIDTVTGKYYGVDAASNGTVGAAGIYVGLLNGPPVAPTLLADFSGSIVTNGNVLPTDVVVDDVTLSTGSTTVTYTEGSSAVVVNDSFHGNSISITDDGTPITSATVSVTNFQSGDTLGVPAGGLTGTNITESYNSATGVLTLSGPDTAAHYRNVLNEVTFSTTAASVAARTISFSASDGLVSGTGSDTVDIIGQPVVGGTSGVTAKFYQSGSSQILDSGITVSDPNGASIGSASVTINVASERSTDTLSFNGTSNSQTFADGARITATYSNGLLNLHTAAGTATAADYQTALREVQYNSSGDPTDGGTDRSRTLTWSVSDADFVNSAGATTALSVFATPAVVIGANSPTPTTSGTPVAADPGLTITDNNASPFTVAGSTATVQISGGFQTGDDLTIGGLTSGTVPTTTVTFSYNTTTHTLTLSGADSLADYQKALDEVQFNATSPNSGSRTLTWQVNDEAGGNTNNSVAVTSTVNAAFPPAVTAGAAATFTGGGGAVTLDSGLQVADSTNPTLASATVTDAGFITGDVLNFTNTNTTTEGNIAGSYVNGVLTLTSSGNTATLAQWQTALEAVTYSFSPGNGDPTNGGGNTSRTIDWQITDTTPQSSAVATSTLTTVHAAPTVTAGNSTTFAVGGAAVAIDGGLTVADPDSGDNLTGATVTISSGRLSGDVLSFTAVGNITGSYSNGTLQLSGNGTVEQYQAVLESVTYGSTAADPSNGGADTGRTISWSVTDGSSSHGTSAAASSTIVIDTPPAITAGAIRTYVGGSAPVILDPTIAITDSFGTLSGATVTVSGLAGDTLMINGLTSGTSGTISYAFSGGTLRLTGTGTTAQYEALLDTVTYSDGNNDPTAGGTFTARTIGWQVTDTASLASNVATSLVNTQHVAPTVTIGAGGSQVFDGGSTASGALDNTLVITDTNSGGNLTGAMVQIVNPTPGEVLNFTSLDGVTSTYSNGVLTLHGTASIADYQTMLRSVTVSFSPQNLDPTAGGTVGKQLVYWIVNDGNTVNGTNETFPSTNAINNDQPSLGLNQIVVEAGPFPSPDGSTTDGIPMGAIRTFAGVNTSVFNAGSAALADGQILSINQQQALFSVFGTNFGGNGVNTFDLPDLQGRVIVGSVGRDGTSFGSNQFTLTHQNLPPGLGGSGTAFDNDQPSLQVNYIINIGGQFGGDSTNAMGEVIPFLGDIAPAGYVFANGQLLSISANTALFSLLGTTYGGDGRFTFALPDLNGKTIIGAGSDAQGQNVAIGTTTGQDSTTLTNQNAPSPLGPDQPVSNDQPSVAMTYLVATQGIFPGGSFDPGTPDLGEVIAFAGGGSLGNMLDQGWAIANGATLSIQQNEALFAVIGTTYGGNGTTTFNLPDLVGRTIAGVGTSGGTTTTLGEKFGTDSFTLTSGNSATQNIPVPDVATSVLTLVHEPPVVTAGASATFDGGGSPVRIDPNLSVSAPDSSDRLTGATVQITGGFHAGDTLSFINNGTTEGNIAGNYANGVLTLSSAGNTATSEQYQAALDSITYSFNPANGDPTIGNTDTVRTISYVVNDGLANSAAATSTLDVVHTPPSVTAGNAATFEFGSTPATLDGALQVSDPDSGDKLTGATVKIDNGFLPGDSLNFTTQNGITVASNSNGVLMLTGNATTEQYQAALDSITFNTTNQTATSHTIDWTVGDSLTTSAVATSTVTVTVGPVVIAGAPVTATEGASTGPVTVATFTDPTIVSPATGDFAATINWGDGLSSSGTIVAQGGGSFAVTGAHTYAEDGSYTVGVAVTDTNKLTGSTSDSAKIADAPLTALGTGVSEGVEGVTPAILNATFRDANPGATASDFSGTVTWGDGNSSNFSSSDVTANGDGTFTVSGLSHIYAEEGTDNINVVIKDAGGSTTTDIGFVTITDAPLTATGTTLSGTEGATLTATVATFTDANPNAAPGDFTATINWGDTTQTTGTVTENGGVFSVTGIHTYAEEGSFSPVVTINDVGSSTAQVQSTATIADAPLTAGTVNLGSGVEGVTPAALTATFSDANPLAPASDFSGTINWGDGKTTAFTSSDVTGGNGNFTVNSSHLYAEEGTYTPTVTIKDDGGSTAIETGTTTVADATLTAGTATVNGGIEGVTAATLSATFSDANTGASTGDFSGTIVWGDGNSTNFISSDVTANGNGTFTVSGAHLYAEEGTYTSSVTINDAGRSAVTETGTTIVADAPLTAGPATATGGVEGVTAATLTASFSDANTVAPAGDFSGTIAWGDGTNSTFNSSNVIANGNGTFTLIGLSHVYAEAGTDNISIAIKDAGGSTTTDTGTTTVADAPLTAAGTLLNSTEGAALTATVATFTDANPNAAPSDFTATIDWGDKTQTVGTVTENAGVFSVTGTHAFAEEGTYTPVVTITDVGGSTAQALSTEVVNDAPLTPGTATVAGGVEGATAATLSATFSDANTGAPTSDFSGTIAWGDGTTSNFTSSDVTGGNGNFTVNGSHLYAEEGTYTPTVTINDAGRSTATETGKTVVADAPLTALGTSVSGTEGTALPATVATFTDANPKAPLSDFTATINWGDGTQTNGTITDNAGVFSVAGTHTYAADGKYTATVTVDDVGGSTAQVTTAIDIVPTAPVITTLAGQPVNGSTVELKGTGDVGETVNLYADGDMKTIVGTGTVGAGGTFDITTTATFHDGVHTFTATETDAANLTSTASTPAFMVDVDPTAPVITAMVGQPVNGGTVELKGTGEVGETVNLYADGTTTIVGTGTVGAGGTFDITTTATFADGVHTFIAKQTDAAHLTSTASAPAFTADVDPNAPVITALVGHPVSNGTVELKGTGEAGQTINLYADGNTTTIVGTGTVDASGNFDITTNVNFAGGSHTFNATETDAAKLTSTASAPAFPVAVGGTLPLNNQGNPLPPPSPDNNQVANFSGLTTLVTNTGTGPTFDGYSPPGSVHVIHSDVTASIGPDGNVAFELPLGPLEAALGGDVVSVTASLADGQPLPTWLHFDTQNGQFAGLLPDNTATGSLTDGGFGTKPNDKPLLPEKITIEVIARDSHGNISITDFTIDLVRTPPKHSWNVLPGHGGFEHWGMLRDTAVPLTGEPILWDGELATEIGRDGVIHVADPVPAGRAGFSEQLRGHGLHALNTDRAALLKNLQHVNWR